jgi:hypothetical protein
VFPVENSRKVARNWLVAPALVLVFSALVPALVLAQGQKSTETYTPTSSDTPTVTPTDSLNVFETPNTPTPDPQLIAIFLPLEEDIVQGVVNITGKTAVTGFSRYEVEFSYEQNPTGTWFLLARSDQPVRNGQLAVWDTRALTDGDYALRLRVYFSDGSSRDALTNGIRVRNYSSTETVVPSPTAKILPTTLPAWTSTPSAIPAPTPIPLPENAAAISLSQVWSNLGRGALVTAVLFLVFGLIIRSRKMRL